MNYNDKNNDKHEMDDMNIKSHLNTSLELNGISVSEDLINRTLAAIKQQAAEQSTNQVIEEVTTQDSFSRKVIPWGRYVRNIAGVAAAIFIVVIGFNAFRMNSFNSKEDKSTSDSANQTNDLAMEQASDSSAAPNTKAKDTTTTASNESEQGNAADAELYSAESTEESVGIAATEPTETEIQYTIMADTVTDDSATYGGDGTNGSTEEEAPATEEKAFADFAATSKADSNATLRSSEQAPVSFREIFLSDPAQAAYITIQNETDGSSLTLTDKSQITEFYTVMDNQQFAYATDTNAGRNYTVEVKGQQQDAPMYTMIIGKYIEVTYTEGDTVSYSSYHALDEALLKQNLDEFYQKYKK